MSRFTERYLDPGSRLGEILFGLILVLTVTLVAGFKVAEGTRGVRQLLLAAICTNVAWGTIDAVMYLMNSMIVRRGKIRLVEGAQHAADSKTAAALVQKEFEPRLQELLDPEDAEALSKSVLKYIANAHIRKKILTKDDFYDALATFWLVFVSCLPAALPVFNSFRPNRGIAGFEFFADRQPFYLGHKWASYSGRNPLLIGTAIVAVGLGLVGVAILLGG